MFFRVAASNKQAILFAARIGAAVTGGFLYQADPRLPFFAIAIVSILAWVFSWFLPAIDPHCQTNASPPTTRSEIRRALNFFHKKSDVLAVLILHFLINWISNMSWYVYQPAFESAGIKVDVIGIIFAVLSGLSMIGTQMAKYLMNKVSTAKIYQLMFSCSALSAVGIGLVHSWWVVFVTVPLQLAFGMLFPVATTYIATRAPLDQKSTILSVLGMTSSSWVVGSMACAVLLDLFGVQAVGFVAATGSLLVLLLIPKHRLREKAAVTEGKPITM